MATINSIMTLTKKLYQYSISQYKYYDTKLYNSRHRKSYTLQSNPPGMCNCAYLIGQCSTLPDDVEFQQKFPFGPFNFPTPRHQPGAALGPSSVSLAHNPSSLPSLPGAVAPPVAVLLVGLAGWSEDAVGSDRLKVLLI